MRSPSLFAFSVAALALPAAAQISTASTSIGPNGVGCQTGGLLTGGVVAAADLTVQYDAGTAQLQLTVANTTPLVAGEATGVINRIYLNLPPQAITAATLLSQTGSGGSPPAFALTFDADTSVGPNPVAVACLGDFNLGLACNSQFGIANPAATQIAVPHPVFGPATFTLQLAGPGAHGISAGAILASVSQGAAAHATNAAVKFQAAGPGGDESGFLGSDDACRTGVYLRGTPSLGNTVELCVTGAVGCHVCLWVSEIPGPVQVGQFTIPIGLPVIASLDLGDFGLNGAGNELCFPIAIPNVPGLVGYTLYFANLSFYAPNPGELSFSPAFTLTVQL